jgi:hypothetical protein
VITADVATGKPIGAWITAPRAEAGRVLDVTQGSGFSGLAPILFLQYGLLGCGRRERRIRAAENQGSKARRGGHRLGNAMPLPGMPNGFGVRRAQEHLMLAGVAEADCSVFRRSKTVPRSRTHASELDCAIANDVFHPPAHARGLRRVERSRSPARASNASPGLDSVAYPNLRADGRRYPLRAVGR